MAKNTNFIQKTESELLSTLFNYIVSFIDKKIRIKEKGQQKPIKEAKNLEDIIQNSKPKIDFKYFKKLYIDIKKSADNYSVGIINKNNVLTKIAPYSIQISYQDNYNEERLSITYKQNLLNYLQQHINSKEDMSNRVPLKWLNILPETMMGGILGFTYLGENFMARRADLIGDTARMVDIHESIHTPDEYETRCITQWIMDTAKKPKYRLL